MVGIDINAGNTVFCRLINNVIVGKYAGIVQVLPTSQVSGNYIPGLIEDMASIKVSYSGSDYTVSLSYPQTNIYIDSDDDFPIAIVDMDKLSDEVEFYNQLATAVHRYGDN